jgi:hypothetical protein
MGDILVFALHYEGAFNKNSLGAVAKAAELAGRLGGEAHALVLGNPSEELCASLGGYGASRVHRVAGPEGLAQPVVDAMAALVGERGYAYALFGGGLLGFEIGAGLAARLGAGVAMEVTGVEVRDGKLVAQRPVLGDSAISEIEFRGPVGIVIARLNAFDVPAQPSGSAATVNDVAVAFNDFSTRARMVTRGEQRGENVDIEGAEILVAGGGGGGGGGPGRSGPRAPSRRRAPSWTPAGIRTRGRSARPARRSRRSCTSRPGSAARSSTRSGWRPRRTSSRSTRTRTLRSSSSPTSASSAISTASCRSSPPR